MLQSFTGDSEEDEAPDKLEIEVWECHTTAVDVWLRCSPNLIPMVGACGVTANEVFAVSQILGVRVDTDILDDIRLMASIADSLRNSRS